MIRFYNGKVLTFSPEPAVSDSEVWVDGNRIAYVGQTKGDSLQSFERQIDLKGNILMPGFKNAHSHTAMVFLRSLADDKPLDTWLSESVWPNEGKLDGEAIHWLSLLGIMEYVSGGITSVFEMYYNRDAFARTCIESGFRAVMCGGMNDFDPDPAMVERDFLKFNGKSDLIGYRLGIHGEYTTSKERIEYVASLAEKYNAPCYLHLCETESEVKGCVERYGKTPPQILNELGFFSHGGGGIHCVHMTDEDIDLFAEKGLYAASCPASNLKLASGIAPLEKMRRAGVRIALGTDGAASNNALDMFREMYLAAALQKVVCGDASAMPAAEALKMACVNGAEMMGLADCTDIAEGMLADMTVMDIHQPNMQPENDLISGIVYSGNRSNIVLTMVNGRILYENGEFSIGADPETIYAEAGKFIKKLDR